MKFLIKFALLLATFSLAAQEYSFDLSNPSHRPKISTPDGSVSLSGEEILSWNAACKNYELALNKLDEKDYENALYLSQQAVRLAPEKVFERWAILILRGDVLRFEGREGTNVVGRRVEGNVRKLFHTFCGGYCRETVAVFAQQRAAARGLTREDESKRGLAE